MAASSRFSISGTISMIDQVSGTQQKVANHTRSFSGTMQKNFEKAGRSTSRFGDVVKGVLGANFIQGTIFRLKDLALEAIDLASSLTEVQNVVDTTFGDMSGEINKFADTALEQFGLSELQAKQFAGTIGAMGKGAGVGQKALVEMSTALSGLAGDYASFYNLPIEEAFNKIRAGISGESEPLKQIGKDMSVAGLKAFALSSGITKSYESMNMAEKYQLRFNYLMSQSKDQIGDFNKTLKTSYANQQRVAKTRFNQILAKAAIEVLPMLTDGFKELNKALQSLDAKSIGNTIKFVLKIFMFLIKTLITLFPVIKIVVGAWLLYQAAIAAIIIKQKIMIAIGWIKYLIMMRSVILRAVIGHWLQIKALIAQKIATISNTIASNAFIVSTWMKIKAFAVEKAMMLKNIAIMIWSRVVMIGGVVATHLMTAATWLLNGALAVLTSPITLVILAIIALIAIGVFLYKNWDIVKEKAIQAWNAIKETVLGVIDSLKQAFFSWVYIGTYLWFGLINAVLTGAEKVGAALGFNVDKIKQIKADMGEIQANIQARSNFASPESRTITNNNTTTTNGRVDINVNAPQNTTTKQSGTMPQGLKLNMGVAQ